MRTQPRPGEVDGWKTRSGGPVRAAWRTTGWGGKGGGAAGGGLDPQLSRHRTGEPGTTVLRVPVKQYLRDFCLCPSTFNNFSHHFAMGDFHFLSNRRREMEETREFYQRQMIRNRA